MAIIYLILGFLLLIKGADWFVDGAVSIAKKFKIPTLVIGLTIVAFGTSAPEAAVSITAALKNNAEIAIGNVVGSNILNIALIVGLTALIIPIAVQDSTIKKEIPFTILSTLLLISLAVDGKVTFWDGIVFLLFFIIFLTYLWELSKNKSPDLVEEEPEKIRSIPTSILWLLIGLIGIVLGSRFTVNASITIATWLGLSERFIGLTIVAFGTSLPELVTSVTAALKGENDIAVGNVVGSNLFNLLFILGSTAVISPIPFRPEFMRDTLISIAYTVVLLFFSLTGKKITRIEGGILLLTYGFYIVSLF